MVTEEELKVVFGMFTEVWRFYKKYAEVQTEDEYWEAVTSEGNQIAKRFGDGRFIRDLTLAVIMELERQGKEVQKP